MQRAGIRRDYKFRATHQSHERAEIERDCCSGRNAGGRHYFLRQIFLSWTETDNAAPAVLFREFAMQFAVALGRPTFRAPASAGIQHVKIADVVAGEFLGDAVFVFGADLERKAWIRQARAGGFGESEIVVHFMGAARIQLFGVKERREGFARVAALESDAARCSGGER